MRYNVTLAAARQRLCYPAMMGGRPFLLIDFEASALRGRGVRSFPIEVALGWPDTGEVWDWPEPEWMNN